MNSVQSDSIDAASTVVIYPSRARLILLTLGSLLFLLLGLWIGFGREAMNIPMWKVLVASYLGVPFFSFCFFYTVYRLMVRRPALILSIEGIIDQASAVSAGLVRWEEIDRIFAGTMQRQTFVSIAVKTPDHFMSRVGGLKARLMRMNISLVGAPVNIPVNALPMTVPQILQTIREFRSKHRV